jgi:uncharacterized protein YukE
MGAEQIVRFPVNMVEQHASTVEQVADGMEVARSAVREVTMERQAYGQLCQFLPAMLSPVFERAVDALVESVDALRETASDLRSAAALIDDADARGAQRVAGVTGWRR